jgi:hypothetical protein
MVKIICIFILFSTGAFAKDPCLNMVKKSKLTLVRELSREEFIDITPTTTSQFGRYFIAKNREQRHVSVWALPYADGNACVIREITKL